MKLFQKSLLVMTKKDTGSNTAEEDGKTQPRELLMISLKVTSHIISKEKISLLMELKLSFTELGITIGNSMLITMVKLEKFMLKDKHSMDTSGMKKSTQMNSLPISAMKPLNSMLTKMEKTQQSFQKIM